MAATKHNHEQSFGRKFDDCPRCDELKAGSPARTNPGVEAKRRNTTRAQEDAAAIRAHFAPGGNHSRKTCGPVCTFGDW
jgi:hypothetical protein